jgi:hypothetical protein
MAKDKKGIETRNKNLALARSRQKTNTATDDFCKLHKIGYIITKKVQTTIRTHNSEWEDKIAQAFTPAYAKPPLLLKEGEK